MSLEYTPSIDIIFGPMYSGKCLGKGTRIIMFDGSIKNVENIVKGDIIMGNDSTPRTIISTTKGAGMMYKINQEFGDCYIVNEEHILSLLCPQTKKLVNISVYDYLNNPKYREYKGHITQVEFREQDVDIDPYILGIWLADDMYKEKISDKDILQRQKLFNSYITHDKLVYLNKYDRYIPCNYKINSVITRLKLLKGMIDMSGIYCHTKSMYRLRQKDEMLANDIVYLSRSLGFLTQLVKDDIYYYIYINYSIEKTTSITIEKIGIGDYYGFTLDGNGLFLLGDFTVTHNTSEVLRRLIIYHEIGMKVLYLNTQLDNRADEAFSTHNETIGKVPFDALKVTSLKDIMVDNYDVIAIDEAQFFQDLKEVVLEWVETKRKIVLIAGLNGDFRRQPFGQINDMIPYADAITKLSPFCVVCIKRDKKMKPALFTKRTVTNDSEILIGGKEAYIPVCRECYK